MLLCISLVGVLFRDHRSVPVVCLGSLFRVCLTLCGSGLQRWRDEPFLQFLLAVLVLSLILPRSSQYIKWIVSAGLAQVSEFSFVLGSRARRAGVISREVSGFPREALLGQHGLHSGFEAGVAKVVGSLGAGSSSRWAHRGLAALCSSSM